MLKSTLKPTRISWETFCSNFLGVKLYFDLTIPEAISVVAYAEFENVIEVDRDRNVKFDFGVWIRRRSIAYYATASETLTQLWKPVVVKVRSSKVAQMLGFYVLLEDPDANVIIIALHCCSGVFCKSWPTLYCWSTQATGEYAAASRRCWSSCNIIHVNAVAISIKYAESNMAVPDHVIALVTRNSADADKSARRV